MKAKNKLEGASIYTAWKDRTDIILEKNKVLNLVHVKIPKPESYFINWN